MRGKKAFVGGAIVDFYAYLMFFLIIVLFYIIFKLTAEAHNERMSGSGDILAGNIYMKAYLSHPVHLDNDEMTVPMADLIRLADENPDRYEDIFEEKTEDFMDKTFPNDLCFFFKIKGQDLEYESAESGCSYVYTDNDLELWLSDSKAPVIRFRWIIPSFRSGKTIAMVFFYDIEELQNAYGTHFPYPPLVFTAAAAPVLFPVQAAAAEIADPSASLLTPEASRPFSACEQQAPAPGSQLDSSKQFEYSGVRSGRVYHLDSSKTATIDGSAVSYACAPEDLADCRFFKSDGSPAISSKIKLENGFGSLDGRTCFSSIGGAVVPERCYAGELGELFYYRYKGEDRDSVHYETSYDVDTTIKATRFDDAGNAMYSVRYACAGDACMFFRDSFNRLSSGIIRLDSGFDDLDGKFCMTSGYGNLQARDGSGIDRSKCVSSASEASKIGFWPDLSAIDMSVLMGAGAGQARITPSGDKLGEGRVAGGTRWPSTGSAAELYEHEGKQLWINMLDIPFTGIVYVTEGTDAGKFILVKKGEMIIGSARSSQLEVEAQYPSLGAPYYTPEYVNREYCS
jgi:hypothetical protein